MIGRWLKRIRLYFEKQPQPDDLVTPRWQLEGAKLADYWKKRMSATNEIEQRRILEQAFEGLYQAHSKACRLRKLKGAIPNVAFEKFKQGWFYQLAQEETVQVE